MSREEKKESVLLKTIKLSFDVCQAEAKVSDKGEVEVKMLVDNVSGFDWPESLKIKGVSHCEITSKVNHVIKGRIVKSSMKLVKFSFKVDKTEDVAGKELSFILKKVDDEQRINYTSDEIVVKVKDFKKKCFLRSCGFFV